MRNLWEPIADKMHAIAGYAVSDKVESDYNSSNPANIVRKARGLHMREIRRGFMPAIEDELDESLFRESLFR